MDDFTAEMFATGRNFDSSESTSQRPNNDQNDDQNDDNDKQPEPKAESSSQKTGLRGGLAAIRQKASLQDRLVEKYIELPEPL